MIRRTLREIANMIPGAAVDGRYGNVRVQGVSTDSRTAGEGCLFIPLAGASFDGHRFAESALEQGASAFLWQRDRGEAPHGPAVLVDDTLRAMQELASAYRDQLAVRIIAVTGSNGKTTTKDLIAAVLDTTYRVHKTQGNYNSHIGMPLTLLAMPENTDMAVLEMGMRGRGEIALLSRLARPEAVVITNIGEAHLERLGSVEEIARAKLEITYGLADDGLLVYHGDNPLLQRELDRLCAAPPEDVRPASWKKFRFGESADNDLFPVAVMTNGDRMHFTLNISDEAFTIPLPGRHNVLNALAATAVAKYMGVGEDDIRRGLQQAKISGMRVELLRCAPGYTILNDAYNASPAAMRAALSMLGELSGYKRKIVVLGDMLELGPEEREYHRQIGEELDPSQVDAVFAFGGLAEEIAKGAIPRFGGERVEAHTDKAVLIERLRQSLRQGDCVLVKGSRSMKLEEIVEALR